VSARRGLVNSVSGAVFFQSAAAISPPRALTANPLANACSHSAASFFHNAANESVKICATLA
jgi:hypothetical protein